jgi:cation-transporting ATPase 13A3/4/5
MLTGESVPVSKVPLKDEDLLKWRDTKEENAKTFLYSGTRVVRIRGVFTAEAGPGRPALALVARTGKSPDVCHGVASLLVFQDSTQRKAP